LPEKDAKKAVQALADQGINAVQIGRITHGPVRLKLIE
jgi:phosphoribosylaminoimidazole (AIR) synthetase